MIVTEGFEGFLYLPGHLLLEMIEPQDIDLTVLDKSGRNSKGGLDVFQYVAVETQNLQLHRLPGKGERRRQTKEATGNGKQAITFF
jgi:hypothetical protein